MKNFTLAAVLLITSSAVAQAQGNLDLQGNWKVVGWTLPGAVPVKNHLPILKFQGSAVNGSTGCNDLNGTFAISGDQVTFSALNSGSQACTDAVKLHESVFLNALSGQTLTAQRLQDSLTLTTSDGFMLNIRRMTNQSK